jgi:hypothetical protein
VKRKWLGRLLKIGGGLGILSALAWAFWPALLEGYARSRVEDALARRFTTVELGCFELQRDSLRVCDLVLEKEKAQIVLEELEVDFDILWGAVSITSITVRGGSIAGELEGFKELRSSDSSRKDAGTPGNSRVQLEELQLEASDLAFDIRAGKHTMIGTLRRASQDGLKNPIIAEFETVELTQGSRVVGTVATVGATLDPGEPFPLTVNLGAAAATLTDDLVIQDVSGTLILADEGLDRVDADLAGATGEGQTWTFQGEVDRGTKAVVATLTAKGLSPGQLPGASLLPLAPDEGTVSIVMALAGTTDQLRVTGSATINGVFVDHPRLARDRVPVDAEIELLGLELDLRAQSLRLDTAKYYPLVEGRRREGVSLEAKGEVSNAGDPKLRQFAVHLTMPAPSPCQGVLESFPREFIPGLEGFVLEGTTSLDLLIHVDMADPDATVFEGGLDLDRCRIKKSPPTIVALSGPFTHVVRMKNGRTATRLMGRGAHHFAAIDELPIHVHAAVVATEDGGFWRHDGFLEKQIKASLKRNVEAGEFRRGGSTITMQMVKNVLLSHEKTLSRKLQELFLTWVVERQLGKDRIMELYLNAVEFGPGIYGIGHAAEHYFGKLAPDLSSFESAFLATLLPRPIERHEFWCRGEVSPKHLDYVHRIHLRMLARHAVTREEFDAAEAEGIVFSRTQWRGEKECLAEGQAVDNGRHVQEAISGLLTERIEFGP